MEASAREAVSTRFPRGLRFQRPRVASRALRRLQRLPFPPGTVPPKNKTGAAPPRGPILPPPSSAPLAGCAHGGRGGGGNAPGAGTVEGRRRRTRGFRFGAEHPGGGGTPQNQPRARSAPPSPAPSSSPRAQERPGASLVPQIPFRLFPRGSSSGLGFRPLPAPCPCGGGAPLPVILPAAASGRVFGAAASGRAAGPLPSAVPELGARSAVGFQTKPVGF